MRRLDHYWYHKNLLSRLLVPVSWLFCLVSMVRRKAYQVGLLKVTRLPVPVIIVGNISVGGTGKTPLVVWLVHFLKQAGYTPAVVSRGYGGKAGQWPQRVTPDGDARRVGDEALLLAQRCHCPMAVAPDRVAAAHSVLKNNECDVIVCDDGLQHYALARDIEIAVIDGVRRFGNGHCLPAGPLREPQSRLESVDFVVVNDTEYAAHGCGGSWASLRSPHLGILPGASVAKGTMPEASATHGQFSMRLCGSVFHHVGNDDKICDASAFHGQVVHAIAGIGHPARFFEHLKKLGVDIIEHAFPDHHVFTAQDLQFDDGYIVVMTEKDAVKCRRFAGENHWYIPVDAQLSPEFGERFLEQLKMRKESNG